MPPKYSDDRILDSCAVINLAVMPCGSSLLERLKCSFYVPEQVLYEVVGYNRPLQKQRAALLRHTTPCALQHFVEFEMFEDFVSRDGRRSLGDGEAAAIALARSRGFVVVTDDGPAQETMVQERLGEHHSTVTLIQVALDRTVISEGDARAGLSAALNQARMAIRDSDFPWVVDLLGKDVVLQHRHLRKVAQRWMKAS